MRKKLFTIALSAIMVIAMAVPAFAGTSQYLYSNSNRSIGIISGLMYNVGGDAYLNCQGTASYNFNNRNVDLYYKSAGTDQTWRVVVDHLNDPVYGCERLESHTVDAHGNDYYLNVYRYTSNYMNCDLMKITGNTADTRLILSGDTYNFYDEMKISLFYYPNYYLGYEHNSLAPLADARWVVGNKDTTTTWRRLPH